MTMNLYLALLIPLLVLLGGCSATMHPDYQPVFYKQSVSDQKIQEVIRQFRSQRLMNATVTVDPLGRVQLSGSYENEREVELAFSIARSVVGDGAVSGIRPELIKSKDWEVSASKGFSTFIQELARKFKMSVNIEQVEENSLIGVSDTGLDGIAQFASNASVPTPNAARFYLEMAARIASSPSEKDKNKRILIVGHTDDIGDSRRNSVLSEERARAVGKIFESQGISSDRIFFQGAGESLPMADNRSESGRAKNRRVDIVDLSNEESFRQYLLSRRPNIAFYRPVVAIKVDPAPKSQPQVIATKPHGAQPSPAAPKSQPQAMATRPQSAQLSAAAPNVPRLQRGYIDFGGAPMTVTNASVNVGAMTKAKQSFMVMLVSEAQASDIGPISSCNVDRPRNAGAVRSLKDGKNYTTSEFLPGLYGRSWQDTVGGNLVVLNDVAVLRYGATPANAPKLRIYSNYNPTQNRNPTPDITLTPEVNAYQGSNGLLYRVFAQGDHGVQCLDVLIPSDGSPVAKAGKVIYGDKGSEFVSDFKPTMIR